MSHAFNGRIGEQVNSWKGDRAGYAAKHLWIIKHHGKAGHCCNCGTETAKRFEWANISGQYKRDLNDYIPLCPSCHRKWDMGNKCRNGHPRTEENIRRWKNRDICKICEAANRIRNRNKKK